MTAALLLMFECGYESDGYNSGPNGTAPEVVVSSYSLRCIYVGAINSELNRIGATGWRLAGGTGYRDQFKGKDFTHADDVELDYDGVGALIRRAPELLLDLRKVPDRAGDEALADALALFE